MTFDKVSPIEKGAKHLLLANLLEEKPQETSFQEPLKSDLKEELTETSHVDDRTSLGEASMNGHIDRISSSSSLSSTEGLLSEKSIHESSSYQQIHIFQKEDGHYRSNELRHRR
jgi:hypothetical protein